MFVSSAEEMKQIAAELANALHAGDVILLRGDLGAGKTTFTQGLAKGLGITTTVDSPTFVLIQTYDRGRLPLHHMDMYRITNEAEAFELGLDEFFYGDGISVVEWPEQIPSFLPADVLVITITKQPEGRMLTFVAEGNCNVLQRGGFEG